MSGGLEMTMKREGDRLTPTAAMFVDDLRSIPEGREVFVSITLARNPAQHRWFFAMLGEIVKAGQWDSDVESLLDFVKIGTGHVRHIIKAKSGKAYYVLRSISFSAMDQLHFERFLRRAEHFIAERMGIDIAALRVRTAESAGPMPPPAEATKIEEPLDERLRAMAFELGFVGGIDATHKHWAAMKTRPEVKALHQRAPAELQELVEAAQEKARGKLSETQFDAMVKAIAARVVRESEAA